MTAGEELRTAAKLMRERAEAATPGPWEASGRAVEQARGDYADVIGSQVECMAYCYGGTAVLPSLEDATYIASMSPPVALAIAALLEELAEIADHGKQPALVLDGLDIARAYLGTADEEVPF